MRPAIREFLNAMVFLFLGLPLITVTALAGFMLLGKAIKAAGGFWMNLFEPFLYWIGSC